MTASIGVIGAGAFGTALAAVLSDAGHKVTLWGRDSAAMETLRATRRNEARLPGIELPATLEIAHDPTVATMAEVLLLAVPTQALRGVLQALGSRLDGKMLVLCCKGVEIGTGFLPSQIVQSVCPKARLAILTGPSFAADIARGKPTALTLAAAEDGESLQKLLSTKALRLYLSSDLAGAQLGGALKNVVAIAAGITIGAGLGDSARAALMTRGFAEMARFAAARGAQPATLYGLSGFGDLVLTCTSDQSRNFRFGRSFGAGADPQTNSTVEGVSTAHAVAESAMDLDLPITRAVSDLLAGRLTLPEALASLMARPLKQE
jgi:glycerol-3-phosphate dehydrogenase (NAD(P)+)